MFGDYLFNNPIDQLVDPRVLILQKDESVINVLYKMLQDNFQEGLIPFSLEDNKGKQMYSILTLSDLSINKDDFFDFDQMIEDKLSKPIAVLPETLTVNQAVEVFNRLEVEALPIEKNGKLVGVIRKKELLNQYFSHLYDMNHKYKDIIYHIEDAVTMIDYNGFVKLWNKKAEELYHISQKEIINRKLVDFLPDALGLKILETRKAIKNVCYSPKADYYVSNCSIPISINSKFIGVFSSEKDLTLQKNLHIQLEKANSKITSLKHKMAEINNNSPLHFDDLQGKDPVLQEKTEMVQDVSKTGTNVPNHQNLEKRMDCYEKSLIEKALETNNYNKSKTAKYLEIPRSTLYYKLEKHKLE